MPTRNFYVSLSKRVGPHQRLLKHVLLVIWAGGFALLGVTILVFKSESDGLFELRLKSAEGIARVFYCTVVDRNIVFLHQFTKKSDKTPSRELKVARTRMRELKNG
jgi:hypothetical protein